VLAAAYAEIRRTTQRLIAPLGEEDCVVQSMPDASPAKWHLAHTTWFFETFVLTRAHSSYQPFDPRYGYLFNSYYNSVGPMHPRRERGLLTRPTLERVLAYRAHVDHALSALLEGPNLDVDLLPIVETGLHHECQHQELLLTDIKHAFSRNPLEPAYRTPGPSAPAATAPELRWLRGAEGVREIGHEGASFSFDNERPRHRTFVQPHLLASRLTTNLEYRAFIEDGGYGRPELWLAEGWDLVRARGWQAPLYWRRTADQWYEFTLAGPLELADAAPVCHVSYYEADAFARWSNARLATEAEWETAAHGRQIAGNLLESDRLHPVCVAAAPADSSAPSQLYGDVWEWTSSPYVAYPGFRAPDGALGEYNGKFMSNQMVLRGGSCASAALHLRASYRNFFPPDARWQFTGIRLARDVENK